MPAVRILLIAGTLIAMELCGCASRSENREQPPVAAPAASSESATSRDQNSAVLESFGGEYDSRELSSYLNDVARRLTPKSDPVTFKVVVLEVGLEDAPFGTQRSNVELVEAAVNAIQKAGGEPATTVEVRAELAAYKMPVGGAG